MKKRLSGLVLVTEIAAIVMLHSFKISHQEKTEKLTRHDAIAQRASIGLIHSFSFSSLK